MREDYNCFAPRRAEGCSKENSEVIEKSCGDFAQRLQLSVDSVRSRPNQLVSQPKLSA